VDLIGFGGRGILLFNVNTNLTGGNGGGAFCVDVQTSPDTNVWTDLSNYALITNSTSIIYTNLYLGTNYATSDSFLLPYTATTPTAASAGYSTPYPAPFAFNNNAKTNFVNFTGNYAIGINLTDCPRYLHVILLNVTATSTNSISANLIGTRAF